MPRLTNDVLFSSHNTQCRYRLRRVFHLTCLFALLGLAAVGCFPHSSNSDPRSQSGGAQGTGSLAGQGSGNRFVDVALAAGITYTYPAQPRPLRNLDAFGCGCAVLDYDGDGWMDILLVASPHPILYRNKGHGTFEDVTAAAGLDTLKGDWKGCAVGDVDGDGHLDILLTGYRCLALLRNVEGRRFVDVTRHAGFDPTNNNHWGSSAGFMDLDGSGRLSLVLLNYVVFGPSEPQYCELLPGVKTGCPPATYRPEYGELWQNRGDGTFTNITAASGMKETHGKALVLAFADVEGNGKIDFYIGNDGTPAELMQNLGRLRFRNIGKTSGASTGESGSAIAGMGADWADYDRDGRPDLAVSAFSNEAYLILHNLGGGLLEHAELSTGIAGPTLKPLGFGTKWLDFDNDGWPDLMFANGHVYDVSDKIDPNMHFHQPLMLFHNVSDRYDTAARAFVDIVSTMPGNVAKPVLGRGLATGDFDNDGRIDALVIDYEGRPMLLHNESETANHWITLDLRSATSNRFAYGAEVTARSGKTIWTGMVSPASSYLSSSDPRIHFGLGSVQRLDLVSIVWPDGQKKVLKDVAADRILTIDEGQGIRKR